jgi:hypothetical protein
MKMMGLRQAKNQSQQESIQYRINVTKMGALMSALLSKQVGLIALVFAGLK